MMDTKKLQRLLNEQGFGPIAEDGKEGPETDAAVIRFQKARGLAPDGDVGPRTESALLNPPTKHPDRTDNGKFDAGSAKRLKDAHPLIQKVMNAARDKIAFQVLDSQRGKKAQEDAFKRGASKAHFGQSAHNWSPAVAVDVVPVPVNWNDRGSFIALSRVIMPIAKELGVPLRWGGDWNMDGNTKDGWDLPHYELHPWRDYAKKPFGE